MATFRTVKNKNNPYVMLNKVFLEDSRISYKAKGILARLLSKPDDWVVYESELITAAADGRDSVRSGIRELINAGYIKRNRKRDKLGHLRKMEYKVYELPEDLMPALPDADATADATFVVDMFTNIIDGSIEPGIREEAIRIATKAIEDAKTMLEKKHGRRKTLI